MGFIDSRELNLVQALYKGMCDCMRRVNNVNMEFKRQ